MDLQVPITLVDALTRTAIASKGWLDLSSLGIRGIAYEDHDVRRHGVPAQRPDYEFTSGTLSNAGKDVEFGVHGHAVTGEHSVDASEPLEIKMRAAALFAGRKPRG